MQYCLFTIALLLLEGLLIKFGGIRSDDRRFSRKREISVLVLLRISFSRSLEIIDSRLTERQGETYVPYFPRFEITTNLNSFNDLGY